MIEVSVILPIYNIPEEYLTKCINSVISQTIKNIEIILVNDGSPNNALEVCNRYVEIDNRVVVLDQKNQGVSVARNAGLSISKGTWIAFVDPDDWLENDYLELMLNKATAHTDIIICNCIVNSPSSIQKNNFLPSNSIGILSDKNVLMGQLLSKVIGGYYPEQIAAGVPWGKLFNRNFLTKHGINFIPGMTRMQDNVFCLYAIHYASEIYFTGDFKYNYRKENQSASFKFNKKIIDHFEFYFLEVSRFLNACLPGSDIYAKALNAKILTSLNSYLLNYFFHKKNDDSFIVVKSKLSKILNSAPYAQALAEIDYNYLNNQERLFVFLLKARMFFILKMIYLAKS